MSVTIHAGDEMSKHEAFLSWLQDHGIDPRKTYEIEVGESEIVARQVQFEGHRIVHNQGDPVTVEFSVAIKSPMPQ